MSKKKIVKPEDTDAKGNVDDEDDDTSSDIDEDELNDFRFKAGVR